MCVCVCVCVLCSSLVVWSLLLATTKTFALVRISLSQDLEDENQEPFFFALPSSGPPLSSFFSSFPSSSSFQSYSTRVHAKYSGFVHVVSRYSHHKHQNEKKPLKRSNPECIHNVNINTEREHHTKQTRSTSPLTEL